MGEVAVEVAGGTGGASGDAGKTVAVEVVPADVNLFEENMAFIERMATAVGQNNMLRANWSAPNKDQAARGWKGKLTCTMELSSGSEAIDDVWRFINKGAWIMKSLARDLRHERARADKAEAELAALRATLSRSGL